MNTSDDFQQNGGKKSVGSSYFGAEADFQQNLGRSFWKIRKEAKMSQWGEQNTYSYLCKWGIWYVLKEFLWRLHDDQNILPTEQLASLWLKISILVLSIF